MGVWSSIKLRPQQKVGSPVWNPISPRTYGDRPEQRGSRGSEERGGSSPVTIPWETRGPSRENAAFHWEKTLQLWPQPCPSIPVMEGMLLAEIPKMLLLLFSQGVEQLAPAPAPAFAHSENSSLSAFKRQVSQQEVILSIHTPGLGDSALRQKQVAVKQTRFTSRLYDRQLKLPGRDFAP